MDRIARVPAEIVQGRYDMICPPRTAFELAAAWPSARLSIVPDAGHSALEPGIRRALVAAVERFRQGDSDEGRGHRAWHHGNGRRAEPGAQRASSVRLRCTRCGAHGIVRGRRTAIGSAADLPSDTEAVVVFVVTAAQTEDVLFGAQGCLAKLAKGAVIMRCATVAPEAARALDAKIGAAGFLMLDAPVSGGKVGAHGGTMTVMASGWDAAFEKAQPVLDAISTKVWRLGDKAGVGSTVKMVNQLLAGVHIATAAEALALGIRAGADPRTLFEVIPPRRAVRGCGRTACRTSWMATIHRCRRSTSSSRTSALYWTRREHRPFRCQWRPRHINCSRCRCTWRGREGRRVRHPGVAGTGRDRTAEGFLASGTHSVGCFGSKEASGSTTDEYGCTQMWRANGIICVHPCSSLVE